jgi:MscS family membrane protein
MWSQAAVPGAAPAPAQPEAHQDTLGRTTPRGTVRGFLTAAGKQDYDTATRYLNTRLRGEAASILAGKLFTVLNRRLPARLNEISDRPEGSLAYPSEPDKDLVGSFENEDAKVEIVVERVDRKGAGSIWLFSRETLAEIPELYAEIGTPIDNGFVNFLMETRIGHIALIQWLALFLGIPLLHFIGARLNRAFSPLLGNLLRRLKKNPHLPDPEFLPMPVRLLLLAFIIRRTLAAVTLPLLARQVWSNIAMIAAITGCVWLVMRLDRYFEAYIRVRLGRRNLTGAVSMLRFARWAVDGAAIFIGVLVALHFLGVNPTTALAGLGVGGIAVALAAQKTLENVIAGISLISDQAIRVGDFLRVGNALGTVSDIGLRSTRIRTLDRTVVNLPNGQIANASLENLSLRDQFWFHHYVGLPYDTSAGQIRTILDGLRNSLAQSQDVDKRSAFVRFLRFGASSLDLEIFAYVSARDWVDFLRIQEELLLRVMDIIQSAGTRLALPSQTIYVNAPAGQEAHAEVVREHVDENAAVKPEIRKRSAKSSGGRAGTGFLPGTPAHNQ